MKFARVNLEPESFGDPRFAHLARLLAMPGGDGHFALIKVALIWSWQTEHYTPDAPCFHVPEEVIEMALGVDGAAGCAALVRARLAEETPEGLRMRGSSHERTGWLWRIRAKSEAGGRAKAESAKRKRANESLPGADHGHAPGVPEQSPLSSLLSVPEKTHTPRARDRVVELAEMVHHAHAVEARKLADAIPGCSGVSVGGGTLAGPTLELVRAAVARWLMEAAERDVEREPYVEAQMSRLVEVRAAKARSVGHVRWWVPSTFWALDGIERDLAQTARQAAASVRAGPGRPPPSTPPPARRQPIRDL